MSFASLTSEPAATTGQLAASSYADPNDIRNAFTVAMSAMYRNEVPLYGDLVRIVRTINEGVLTSRSQPLSPSESASYAVSERLDLERHGAIRLGTPYELRTVRRLFSVIGLKPVGYYDLSVADLPMHATCFRPVETVALAKNPFRIFTTLLRPELLQDEEARKLATALLDRREIFSPELLDLLNIAEHNGNRLSHQQAENFVNEAMKTFSWKPVASASESEYKTLASEHPILADIASFKSSHINHLTPRTLDITASQRRMSAEGLQVKDRIEGPPARKCPILLRQTSFLALEERIKFRNAKGSLIEGTHRARFGEIEERGAAVTIIGRTLYDQLLVAAMDKYRAIFATDKAVTMDDILADVFQAYPDDWAELRKQGLVYCTYQLTTKPRPDTVPSNATLESLVSEGFLTAEPITYEDFLPFSAAGIFQSNLQESKEQGVKKQETRPDQAGFETALGCSLLSADALYLKAQTQSLEQCAVGSGWDVRS
ncbi:hypothetical protein B0J13DRAFT_453115 [Dactylonectria estremocensis]|uniref:2-oxoadipate dioxygenase/decarboxylase n=1 Tax=Dactylonectria estremocensis TaxID=1079267 RepID=A0A9P9IR69_9HYPO|nr:hypothetical protein B0J13DRAFT_453115 [Dactylonectria estremocensis]